MRQITTITALNSSKRSSIPYGGFHPLAKYENGPSALTRTASM